ncbi:hypothetical protein N9B32_05590 [Akkermansiaceae bacterium]|nr:hypothetical protein [Akkermansiaceae bacterium]
MDNVFIKRLWRSIKYEKLKLWAFETVGEVVQLVSDWRTFTTIAEVTQPMEVRLTGASTGPNLKWQKSHDIRPKLISENINKSPI